jgi:hypothetical protein
VDDSSSISVVIVSWNVRDLLRQCLQAVLAQTGRHQVIVVDNASTDGTLEMLRADFPEILIVANRENRGYTGGNNQGFQLASGKYILVLNPDTRLQPGAIVTMQAFLEGHPAVAVVGPRLLWPDGSVQSSRRRFPTLMIDLLENAVVQRFWAVNVVLNRYYCNDLPNDVPQPVDWVVGACIMLRREVVEQIGGFDEGYFMYSEEADWCFRAKAAGWEVWHLPEAAIIHYHGKSSEQNLLARENRFQDSRARFLAKHRGRWQAVIFRLFLMATYAIELAGLWAASILSSRNRAGKRARLQLLGGALLWQAGAILGRKP